MNNIQYKSFPFEIKAEEEGVFEGYASIFGNIDSYRDIVVKGAFNRTINNNKKRIKILWQHDMREPIGKPVEMHEDEKGLYMKAKLCMGTPAGQKCFELMKEGIINELSIGYDSVIEEYDKMNRVRYLKEVKLYEVSAVTFAANDMAKVAGVKTLDMLLDEVKTGRILSSGNRDKIKNAIESLMALLDETDPDKSTQIIKDTPQNIDIDPETIHSILQEIKKYQ